MKAKNNRLDSGASQGALTTVNRLIEGLIAVGADRDEYGRFLLSGDLPPQFLLGIQNPDNEVLVTNRMFCTIDGQPKDLLSVATRYGQGTRVAVIC